MAEDAAKPDCEELCKELQKQLDDLQKKHGDLHAEHDDLQKQHADLEKRFDDRRNSGQPEATEKSSELKLSKFRNSHHVILMSSGHILCFSPSALDNVVHRQEARETKALEGQDHRAKEGGKGGGHMTS